ncbi:MAG: TonB-dependent receptor [Dysgonamonadaceae bacterium]|jgi:TonB-linked SusC/RagA family outer membrane protein|nr:TonB-dependent receptor [Dysgonamonadaceae bacterium]
MKKLMLFLLVLCTSAYASAQTTVNGVVSSNEGERLIGVSVTVKGTAIGVATDSDGNFSLTIPSDRAVLIFSYIGYKSKEISVTGSSKNLQVVLYEDNQLLDELVVVGYGTMKKSDLSGASASISEEKLKGSIFTNIDQALQGRATGITSVMTSGAPGSSVSIRVRGQATLNAGAEPLYVIDGVIWQGGTTSSNGLGLSLGNGSASAISPLSTLNPSDIVSMEILKDASATAIYGAQGSNGVILITTKRGKSGEAKFSYDAMFGVQNQVKRLDMMNLRDYAAYSDAIAKTTGGSTGTSEYSDPALLGAGTDWQNAVFRTALMSQHTISAQGGTDAVKYYVSGSYMDQEGTMIATDFKRYSFRTNLDANLKPWLKLGLNAMYSATEERLGRAEGTEGIITYSLKTPPDMPIYDAYGNYATIVRQGYTTINPIAIAHLDENNLNRQKLNGNFFFDVTPIKNLTWHAEFDYDLGFSHSENWQPTYDFGNGVARAINKISWQENTNKFWALKNYVTYTGNVDKHSFTAMAGQEAWESSWQFQRIQASNLPSNAVKNPTLGADLPAINDGYGSAAMASFFTRETYNYDDRYLLTYTFRYDGSSNFGPQKRWAPFHSVAASWRFSNEAFFESLNDVISNGKMRIGWGQTGNQNIGGGGWLANLTSFPTGLGASYRQDKYANPYIQWETQKQWNVGLDLAFFHDRINLTVDAYDKTSDNLLMNLNNILPSYMGTKGNGNTALTAPNGNFGEINNKGLEVALTTHNLTGAFKWDTDFQISFNKNKLVALSGSSASGIEGVGQWNDRICLTKIGGSLYEFDGWIADGVYTSKEDIETHLWGEIPANGYDRYSTVFVGDIKYRDLSGPDGVPDGKIDDYDRTSIGSPLPKFTYGFNNTFSYKNFDLTVFIQGSYGNKIFNGLNRDLTGMGYWSNQLRKAMDYANLVAIDPSMEYPIVDEYGRTLNNWFEDINNVTLSNPNTKMSRAGQGLPYNNQRTSTQYIEDGSYLRIKNIMFGYTLPKKLVNKWKIENIRVYANIQNLFTLTKYSGYDPEVGANPQDASGYTFGFDMGRYPAPRVISFGLNLSF